MYWMTSGTSFAFDMIFTQFLSMPWNRFDSWGSCLAMSPEVKTASRYIHIACTCIHCSRISDTVDSFTIHSCTLGLKGSTYRDAITDSRFICVSSSASISSAVAPPLRMIEPRDLNCPNVSTRKLQSASMSTSFVSIACSFTAELAMSSTSSAHSSNPASSSVCSLNWSEPTFSSLPVSCMSCSQWRARIAGWTSEETSGSDSRKSSTVFFSSTKASHERSSLGMRLHAAWNSSIFFVIAAIVSSSCTFVHGRLL